MTPNDVFIVWPDPLEGRKHLVPFYRQYIPRFMPGTVLHIILKDMGLREGILRDLARDSGSCDIVFHEIPHVMDIWIRDWAPVPVAADDGSVTLVKAVYSPGYIKEKDRRFCEGDDAAGRALASILGLPMVELPLVWDLGNLTRDGHGTAIVTDRILYDNRNISTGDMRELFNLHLGIERLVIIPVEPGDMTGHVDGTVRFIGHDVLAVGRYPDDHVEQNRFMDMVEEKIRCECGDDFRIVHVPHGSIDERSSEGIGSAHGNHLNFFIGGDTLYMPCYRIRQDRQAYRALRGAVPDMDIVMVDGDNIDDLARKGGVLNCMTWGM